MNRKQRRDASHRRQPVDRNASQPSKIGFATLCAAIQRDLQQLRLTAGLHTWTGNNAIDTLASAGRLLWIVMDASIKAGVSADAPDIRILQGMGNALGDLQERGDPLDAHRPALQSGLLAIDRLLPSCREIDLLIASAELNQMISQNRGMGTADLQQLLEQA